MFHSTGLRWLATLLIAITAAGVPAQSTEPPAPLPRPPLGKPAPDFVLKDLTGQKHRLAELREKPEVRTGQVVVLLWWAASAPVAAKTDPEVCAVHAHFAPRGVRFFAINPFLDPGPDLSGSESRTLAAELKRVRGIRFPVLVDRRREVSRRFGARRIPEAVVLDRAGVIRYRGAVVTPLVRPGERQYRRYLHDALNAVLAGKKIDPAETKVWGTEIPYYVKRKKKGAGGQRDRGAK